MKLIVNKTTNEFTYSDNPIVFYNQFLEMKGRSEIGCNSVGIEILLPISPFLYLILYDAQIYHIGKSQSDTIETYDNDDIDNLNRLQILSANSNIYFSKDSTQQYIEKIAENKSNYRRKNMSTVTEYHSVTNKYKSLIGIHAIPIVPRFLVLQIILYSPLFPKWGTLFFGVLTPFFSSFFSRCSLFSSSVFPKIFKTGNAIFRVLTPFSGICSPVPRVPQNFYTHIEKKKCVQKNHTQKFFLKGDLVFLGNIGNQGTYIFFSC